MNDRLTLTESDLVQLILESGNLEDGFSDGHIGISTITHGQESTIARELKLTNYKITGDVILSNFNGFGRLNFIDVQFDTFTLENSDETNDIRSILLLSFELCTIEKITINKNPYKVRIGFENPKNLKELVLNTWVEIVGFNNPAQMESLISLGNVHFNYPENSVLNGDTIFDAKFIAFDSLSFNQHFSGKIDLIGCKSKSLSSGTPLPIKITLDLNCEIGDVRFSHLNGEATFSQSKIKFLYFIGAYLDRTIPNNSSVSVVLSSINFIIFDVDAAFKSLKIERESKIAYLAFRTANINIVSITYSVIDQVNIWAQNMKFDQFDISGTEKQKCHVNTFVIKGGIFQKGVSEIKSALFLQNISINAIFFDHFINQSSLYIVGLKFVQQHILGIDDFGLKQLDTIREYHLEEPGSTGILKIKNSDLGKINLVSCDFAKMKLELVGSKINEVYLTGTAMPEEVSGSPSIKQLGYYQLKKIFEGQGDSVQAMYYQAKELDSYHDQLKSETPVFFSVKNGERITLWFNKYSNYFGTSWGRTIWWLLLGSTPLFMIYSCSIGYKPTLNIGHKQWCDFWEITPFFLEFLFPIHKADFIPEAVNLDPNGWSRIVESFGRLFNGYVIFQFVQAFRKFGKK